MENGAVNVDGSVKGWRRGIGGGSRGWIGGAIAEEEIAADAGSGVAGREV